MILDDQLVGSNTNMECICLGPASSLHLPFLLIPIVRKDLEGWTPLLELHLPVQHDAGGYDNEVRAPHTMLASQVG